MVTRKNAVRNLVDVRLRERRDLPFGIQIRVVHEIAGIDDVLKVHLLAMVSQKFRHRIIEFRELFRIMLRIAHPCNRVHAVFCYIARRLRGCSGRFGRCGGRRRRCARCRCRLRCSLRDSGNDVPSSDDFNGINLRLHGCFRFDIRFADASEDAEHKDADQHECRNSFDDDHLNSDNISYHDWKSLSNPIGSVYGPSRKDKLSVGGDTLAKSGNHKH